MVKFSESLHPHSTEKVPDFHLVFSPLVLWTLVPLELAPLKTVPNCVSCARNSAKDVTYVLMYISQHPYEVCVTIDCPFTKEKTAWKNLAQGHKAGTGYIHRAAE